ncbi:MAG: uroporphyrinogen-III synthase [Betaproteobacteria bacterium]|nr:uroporphyrinogen-III synthase [Betaproteobacteria bacterium]MCL2887256.1 uroporphyrinogen-III synthase [Betaproteobacteria bacterium]
MNPTGPLAGRVIAVTRPAAQAGPLAEAIAAAGGVPLLFPLLAIAPAADPQPLAVAAGRLASYDWAVFISPNAVDHALPALLAAGPWPPHLRPAAVGPGTVRALAAHGIGDCLAPNERYDSEALLACPELAAERVAGRRVAIFRGDGGRELLADTLRARGASVDCIACYRRSPPADNAQALLAAWRQGRLAALTVSSSEGLRYLLDLLDAEGRRCLQATPLFVPHERIAETARQLGLDKIILSGGADKGIMAALLAYNWLE